MRHLVKPDSRRAVGRGVSARGNGPSLGTTMLTVIISRWKEGGLFQPSSVSQLFASVRATVCGFYGYYGYYAWGWMLKLVEAMITVINRFHCK